MPRMLESGSRRSIVADASAPLSQQEGVRARWQEGS